MTSDPGSGQVPDEQLVRGFAAATAAEQHARFGVVCDRYLNIIVSFCASVLRDPEASSDAAQETFLAAFQELCSGTEPDGLRPWLYGIARHKCIGEYRGAPVGGGRRRGSADLLTLAGDVDRPEFATLEDLENLSRRRLAEVEHLLDLVASTLTERQQRLYELAIRQDLRGARLGTALNITPTRAYQETWKLIGLLDKGFGAYILARDGRRFCPALARILDAAVQGSSSPTPAFTTALRERIVAHFGTCDRCDDCRTCDEQRKRLAWAYTPVLIPVLVLGVTRQRIDERIRHVSAAARLPSPPVPPLTGGRRRPPRHPSRQRSRRRRLVPWLLVPLLVIAVVIGVVALRPRGAEPTVANPAVRPASLAGTWDLTPLNEPGSSGPPRNPSWSFTGRCETATTCAFTWLPLTSTTTFESEFTQDFHDSAARNPPQAGIPSNIAADLVVRPTSDGQAYGGQATAQYGIFDEQNQTFSSGQETVILTVTVLASTTGADGGPLATRLSVNVTYAGHDFDPCFALCGHQSFGDLKRTLTAVAIRRS